MATDTPCAAANTDLRIRRSRGLDGVLERDGIFNDNRHARTQPSDEQSRGLPRARPPQQALRRGQLMNDTSSETETLERLLIRTAMRDRAAFSRLYELTSARLFGLCVRMLRDRGEAEEVLQEAFISIWRRADGYDSTLASANTWLTTLVRNRAIDRLRQRREDTSSDPLGLEELPDESRGPAADAEASEDYRRLERCLGQLDTKYSRSVREAFFSGATYKELAIRCEVPLATMKSWIRRALLQLRTCLET